MSTLAARQTAACTGAAALITSAWSPTAPNEVIRDYVDEEVLKSITGRKVFLFPTEAGAKTIERANRGELINEHLISIRVFEKFTDPGRPTQSWIDARVSFLDTIYSALDTILPGAYLLGSLWCQTLEITDVADVEAVDANKLFFASIEGSYREIVAG